MSSLFSLPRVVGTLHYWVGVQHLALELGNGTTPLAAFPEESQCEEKKKSPVGERWNAQWMTSRRERLMDMGAGARSETKEICGAIDSWPKL